MLMTLLGRIDSFVPLVRLTFGAEILGIFKDLTIGLVPFGTFRRGRDEALRVAFNTLGIGIVMNTIINSPVNAGVVLSVQKVSIVARSTHSGFISVVGFTMGDIRSSDTNRSERNGGCGSHKCGVFSFCGGRLVNSISLEDVCKG